VVEWRDVAPPSDAPTLDAWCANVGPAVVLRGSRDAGHSLPTIVSWNVDVGGGDVDALLDRLMSDRARPTVVLLQEAFRGGSAVPVLRATNAAPHRIAPSTARRSIVDVAIERGLSLVYVPSMRNGSRQRDAAEDRGNAILANVPLLDPMAIELPFEHQRRVAVAASVGIGDTDGRSATLRVVSAHLDARATWRHGFVLWFGRERQAAALRQAVADFSAPAVVGGDLNTWLGDREPAVEQLRADFPQTPRLDTSVTFPLIGGLGFDLDHLFFRLPPRWKADVTRLDVLFGSDHFPLVSRLTPP
jgi:endonuclease/exonuclease/phosphatase family metal-dependent hydrolase